MRRPAPRPSQWLPWALLSLAPVVLPWVWSPLREPLLAGLYPGGVWAALWPLLAALGLASIALQRGWRVPRRLRQLPNPALVASLRLTRLLRRPPLPEPDWQPDRSAWRRRERHWNRWLDRGVLAFSAWLLALLLWLGWLW